MSYDKFVQILQATQNTSQNYVLFKCSSICSFLQIYFRK